MVNPTTYVVTCMRYMMIEDAASMVNLDNIPIWLCFVVIIAFAFLGTLWGYSAFKRSLWNTYLPSSHLMRS